MFTKHSGHAWHMVLMGGVAVVAFWFGGGLGDALLLALLACTAMMVAMVWIAVRLSRNGVVDPVARHATPPRGDDVVPGRQPHA
jgi:hypothetical protein